MSETLNLVQWLLVRGRRLQDCGRPQDALPVLRRLARTPGLPCAVAEEVHGRLADLWLGRDEFRKARRHLTAALVANPDNARLHFRLGDAFDRDPGANPRAALRHYREALHRDPDQPDCLVALGKLLARLDRAEEGVAALRRAAELRPDDPEAIGALAEALIEEPLHDTDAALAVVRAARFRHPRDARFLALWHRFQFRRAAAGQRASRNAETGEASAPAVLPFVRIAAVTEESHAALSGGIVRLDRGSRPAPHLPSPARRSDPKHAP
jgi:tetratricopeptide (TPR) repeat protein